MPPRLHCPPPLQEGAVFDLPPAAARHVQVLRLQPGDEVTLFDGTGGEWQAQVAKMGRADVAVRVGAYRAIDRQPAREVHLALGVPANDRMDWLVEKAAELGVASIQPLATERSVLRLSGERAQRRQAHWQSIAAAACEQCGGNRVPVVHALAEFAQWQPLAGAALRFLSFDADARPLLPAPAAPIVLLSGPEGGLSPAETQRARSLGFEPVTLGPRVLRAETAPIAALSALVLAAS
ncbi:16S rRNA (uracil(1498)-N(3))-methyltransferase [Ramlibacter humi]|uniref:Ribosomal RNA small subunit methyltransferase E n=1 Tax=Ramlibacter humi TaxID=2530451 RepID=A0A4Z0BSX5_9BURK|nr:16S rRNA (uracil(1498)-N(3))-methyltransferase [Ramlibacter humi]TFZ01941.1 16S rRNA (uracil(1498)-N(3))-methyltransferase [Ramlibacter humi]